MAGAWHDHWTSALARFAESPALLLLALLLGTAIGAEREYRQHAGGLRTCALIAAAACVFARLVAEHGGGNTAAGIGAIATGVGFLGAGVITRLPSGEIVGLSTAATFWGTAAIGAAVGLAEFGLAFMLSLAMLFAQEALRPITALIARRQPPRGPEPK
ncbi:MgtC/SapB family protein [Roseomonas sp. NAR14]|uniref:Protein MgtC n=1 Tax=Roseomonas acroporae TaxID=2937791 RepID=A0A9X2BUM6_9PROT|nr:MgtC/SapB family protein [Roseomonas acroporae]MCK8785652.1 MgtC/SapB family protein [Roseomonas acroporae]